MKQKKPRVNEVTFYEWRLTAWMMSETRGRLKALGRGVYRELLDHCYGQGNFPDDKAWMSDRCACTLEELETVWPIIKKHFPISKKNGYRHNKIADVARRRYFLYITGQRDRRLGAKFGSENSNVDRELHKLAPDPVPNKDNQDGSYLPTKLTKLTNTTKLTKQYGEWPLTGSAIAEHFDEPDFPFLLKLVRGATEAIAEIENPKIIITDIILSKALRHCYKGDGQTSAGLYLTTIPPCLRSWARNGIKTRDSPGEPPEETETQRRARDEETKAMLRARGIFPVGMKETHGPA